jgi:transposase-like protein
VVPREQAKHDGRMRRRYTEKERTDLIELVTAGRATVAEAAVRQGVTLSTAYKWMRDSAAVRERRPQRSTKRSLAAPTFVRVLSSRATEAAIAVRIGVAEIQVRRDFDADLLRAVVEALGGGAA